MFKVLGFTEESAWKDLVFTREAFKFGPPNHNGGLAFGFDRMVMFLTNRNNIIWRYSSSKNQNAFDPMTEAPNVVDEKQLTELQKT